MEAHVFMGECHVRAPADVPLHLGEIQVSMGEKRISSSSSMAAELSGVEGGARSTAVHFSGSVRMGEFRLTR